MMRAFSLTLTFLVLQLTPACQSTTKSDVKIVNGQLISDLEFPAVVKLVHKTTGKFMCTGSFISPRLILTAAHCLHPDLTFAGVAPRQVYSHRSTGWIAIGPNAYDLAVLQFDRDLTRETLPLYNDVAKAGDTFTIVGFGCTKENTVTDEKKRSGQARIFDIFATRDVLLAGAIRAPKFAPGEGPIRSNSDTCSGDSGGPLLINGKIAGVTSGALSLRGSIYANLTIESSRAFLKELSSIGVAIPGVDSQTTYKHLRYTKRFGAGKAADFLTCEGKGFSGLLGKSYETTFRVGKAEESNSYQLAGPIHWDSRDEKLLLSDFASTDDSSLEYVATLPNKESIRIRKDTLDGRWLYGNQEEILKIKCKPTI